MKLGHVSGHHALVPVLFQLADTPAIEIEFVIDTGFAGFLTLPLAAVTAMKLPYRQDIPGRLADDSPTMIAAHAADIVWNGRELHVEVLAMGKRPLLGMALLRGTRLCIDMMDNGSIEIDTLP